MESKPRIGISSCLLGNKVRHDGGHKHDPYITQTLGRHVEWVPVCPELEVGMGVPRETVRLMGSPSKPKMIADKSGKDWTREMQAFADERVGKLKEMNLSGYILKKNSPSCGMERVRVYGPKGMPNRQGRGLFAQTLMTRLPLLPVEEEGRLYDPGLRENFIERVFGYYRWHAFVSDGRSIERLVNFHSREKLLIFAHSETHMRRLGRLVAQVKKIGFGTVTEEYGRLFMEALGHRATVRKNANVLEHMLGYFSDELT
ncbi:MAG: DUF1722 domain-containing protein, partial [Deltaproteobacteria bacterium]|nr:DUF1722 domain-containing protein [Deltaproteobacteria bacterium]